MIDFIVPAAGSAKRMKKGVNKLLLKINNKELLYYTLSKINQNSAVKRIILTVNAEEKELIEALVVSWCFKKQIVVVEGGKERADSVRNGLLFIHQNSPASVIMIHDGARPFFSNELIDRLYTTTKEYGAAVPVLALEDTIRGFQDGSWKVVDRNRLLRTQTPQAFLKGKIDIFLNDSSTYTDDAAYLEGNGEKVAHVEGEKNNFKVTTPEDLEIAEFLILKSQN